MVNVISAAAVRTVPVKRQTVVKQPVAQETPRFYGLSDLIYRFPMTSHLGTAALLAAGLIGLIGGPANTLKNQTSTSVVTATLNTAAETQAVKEKAAPNTAEFMAKFREEYASQKQKWKFENYMAFKQPPNLTQGQYQFTTESIRLLNWCTGHRDNPGVSSAKKALAEVNLWIDTVAKPQVGEQTAAALKDFAKQEVKDGVFTSAEKSAIRLQNAKVGAIILSVAATLGLAIDGVGFGAFSKNRDTY